MGIYIKGAFGAFSGKVGNLVGSNWRSITYMRSLPKRSSKPATEKQTAHRAKFALAVKFLSPLRELIKLGFDDKSRPTMTAFNKATDDLIANIEGVYPDYKVPYDKVQFSSGRVSTIVPVVDNDGGAVQLTWKSLNSILASGEDEVVLVFYSEELDDFFVIQEVNRAAGEYLLDTEFLPDGDFHLWTMACNAKGQYSKTYYAGTITI